MDEVLRLLLAAIEATEQDARAAVVRKSGGEHWAVDEARIPHWGADEQDAEVIGGGKPIVQCSYEYGGPMVAAHIARHDPASVLRRCAADRLTAIFCREVLSIGTSPPAQTLARLVLTNLADAYGVSPADPAPLS